MQTVCVFVHMPKAGGSTLQGIIQRQFSPAATFDVHGESLETVQASVDRLRRMPEAEREQIACLKGHVPFGIHQWLPRAPRYVTMLRNPVQRIVSDYYFSRNTPDHILYEHIRRNRLSLKDFIVLRDEQGLSDLYCRMLSEPMNWDKLMDSPRALPPGALGGAKGNLERCFAAVGVTERFDESLLLMQSALGWRDVCYERDNVTRDKPAEVTFKAEEMEAIRAHYARDIELYEFAWRLMDARIAAAGSGFGARLKRFRQENDRHQRWRRLRRAALRWLRKGKLMLLVPRRHGRG